MTWGLSYKGNYWIEKTKTSTLRNTEVKTQLCCVDCCPCLFFRAPRSVQKLGSCEWGSLICAEKHQYGTPQGSGTHKYGICQTREWGLHNKDPTIVHKSFSAELSWCFTFLKLVQWVWCGRSFRLGLSSIKPSKEMCILNHFIQAVLEIIQALIPKCVNPTPCSFSANSLGS